MLEDLAGDVMSGGELRGDRVELCCQLVEAAEELRLQLVDLGHPGI